MTDVQNTEIQETKLKRVLPEQFVATSGFLTPNQLIDALIEREVDTADPQAWDKLLADQEKLKEVRTKIWKGVMIANEQFSVDSEPPFLRVMYDSTTSKTEIVSTDEITAGTATLPPTMLDFGGPAAVAHSRYSKHTLINTNTGAKSVLYHENLFDEHTAKLGRLVYLESGGKLTCIHHDTEAAGTSDPTVYQYFKQYCQLFPQVSSDMPVATYRYGSCVIGRNEVYSEKDPRGLYKEINCIDVHVSNTLTDAEIRMIVETAVIEVCETNANVSIISNRPIYDYIRKLTSGTIGKLRAEDVVDDWHLEDTVHSQKIPVRKVKINPNGSTLLVTFDYELY